MMKVMFAKLVLVMPVLAILCSCSNDRQDPSPFASIYGEAAYAPVSDSIRNDPGNAALYFRRGTLLQDNRQFPAALYDFRRAWELEEKEEYGVAAASLLLEKNADSAIIFLEGAVQKHPESIFFKLLLADGYIGTKKDTEAFAMLDRVLTKWPGSIDALLKKSQLHDRRGEKHEALRMLEQAWSLKPSDAELAHELAFRYAENKDPRVLKLSDSLISVDVEGAHGEPYYFKGVYFANLGNTQAALQLFDQAIQHDYYFLDAYLEKGRILYNQRRYTQAQQVFRLATTVSPTYADAYYWLGKTQEALDDKVEAKLNYQRAYGLDKTLVEAKQAAERL